MSALKLKELTVIIAASSLCLWSVDIASVNAAQIDFTFKNDTKKTATDFHLKYKLYTITGELNDEIDVLNIYFNNGKNISNTLVPPIAPGESFNISLVDQQFISAEWSFDKGDNVPVSPVPEPTTLLGTATTLGLLTFFKKHKSKK